MRRGSEGESGKIGSARGKCNEKRKDEKSKINVMENNEWQIETFGN